MDAFLDRQVDMDDTHSFTFVCALSINCLRVILKSIFCIPDTLNRPSSYYNVRVQWQY